MTERWWLVAGLRKVGIRWFDVCLECGFPFDPRIEVERLTSLLGSNGDGLRPLGNMEAADPWENVNEGESGPTLDRGLAFCEFGIIDNLLIQDPFEEIESRRSDLNSEADVFSPNLPSVPIHLVLFFGLSLAVYVWLMYR